MIYVSCRANDCTFPTFDCTSPFRLDDVAVYLYISDNQTDNTVLRMGYTVEKGLV